MVLSAVRALAVIVVTARNHKWQPRKEPRGKQEQNDTEHNLPIGDLLLKVQFMQVAALPAGELLAFL